MKKQFLTTLAAFVIVFVQQSIVMGAPICQPFYEMSDAPESRIRRINMSDLTETRHRLNFRTSFSYETSSPTEENPFGSSSNDATVTRSVSIDSRVNTSAFSTIFMNVYNVLLPFVTTTGDEQMVSGWENYCINPNDIQTGNFTVSGSGAIRYKTQSIGEGYDDEGNPVPQEDQDTETDGGLTATSTDNTLSVPYVSTLREVALKIPPIIDARLNYCFTGQQGSCMLGYECQEIAPENVPFYPGKPADMNGVCVQTQEILNSNLPYPQKFLCIPVQPAQVTERIVSNACYSNDQEHAFERNLPPPNIGVGSGYLAEAEITSMSNQLPFDIEVYNKYYKGAFLDKLSTQNLSSVDWMFKLPLRMRMDIATEQPDGLSHSEPMETSDYANDLGGYTELANDMRFMNPELLPAGWGTMISNGQMVHMRGGYGYHNTNGVLFYNNQIYGNMVSLAQARPFIHANNKGVGIVTLGVLNNNSDETKLYVATSNSINTEPSALSELTGNFDKYYPAIFVNSEGDKIVFARDRGEQKYKYAVSINGSFAPLQQLLDIPGITIPKDAEFAIGYDDVIHILWRPVAGESVSNSQINYSAFRFRSGVLQPVVINDPITQGLAPAGEAEFWDIGATTANKAMDIHVADDGTVMAIAQGLKRPHGKLFFTTRKPGCTQGCWSQIEVAAEPSYDEDNQPAPESDGVGEEYISLSINGKKISSFRDALGFQKTFVIFRRSIRQQLCDDPVCERVWQQIFISQRISPGNWSKAVPISVPIDPDWHRGVYGEGLDRQTLYFTLDEQTGKFDVGTGFFDPPGTKQVIMGIGRPAELIGSNSNKLYVVPPTRSHDKKICYAFPGGDFNSLQSFNFNHPQKGLAVDISSLPTLDVKTRDSLPVLTTQCRVDPPF